MLPSSKLIVTAFRFLNQVASKTFWWLAIVAGFAIFEIIYVVYVREYDFVKPVCS